MNSLPRIKHSLLLTTALLLAACGTGQRGGGYYQADGPGVPISSTAAARIPDAVPRIEPHAPANGRPYTIAGRRFVPMTGSQPFTQEGTASWYGSQFHGRKTANGERYDMYAMTAAHPTLPLPSYARVTRLDTGRSIVVRVNDRGPFKSGRIIDLSYAAAAKLGFVEQGSARVRVQAITHEDIRRGRVGVNASAGTGVRLATAASPTTNAPVYLQFGAFGQQSNAQSLLQTLTAQLPANEQSSLHIHHNNGLYRVRTGPYSSRLEALGAAERIRQQTGWVVSLGY